MKPGEDPRELGRRRDIWLEPHGQKILDWSTLFMSIVRDCMTDVEARLGVAPGMSDVMVELHRELKGRFETAWGMTDRVTSTLRCPIDAAALRALAASPEGTETPVDKHGNAYGDTNAQIIDRFLQCGNRAGNKDTSAHWRGRHR